MATFAFISANGGTYLEKDTLADLCFNIRQHAPCNTVFKAIAKLSESGQVWDVISLSPYAIGPNYIGKIVTE